MNVNKQIVEKSIVMPVDKDVVLITCTAHSHVIFVANVHSLYILGIGLGRWAVNRHERGSRQCCRRASVVQAVSWVAISDSRLYRWRPPVVTRVQPGSLC